jgi:hypothetical protein
MLTFLLVATAYVAGRMVCYAIEENRLSSLLAVTAVQSTFVAIVASGPLYWYISVIASLAVLSLTAATLETKFREQDNLRLTFRLLLLLVGLVLFGFLCGSMNVVPRALPRTLSCLGSGLAFRALFTKTHALPFWSRTFGLLLCLFEAGNVVQISISLLKVKPPSAGNQSFQHSAPIGAVERILVLIFVLNGAFNAVAFILTAKSVVRYHDIVTTKDGAEYVLIGTLLSTLTAITVGLLVPALA